MKTYKEWLVMGQSNGKTRVATSFHTRKEATERLDTAGFKRISVNLWEDSMGQKFFITKNKREY